MTNRLTIAIALGTLAILAAGVTLLNAQSAQTTSTQVRIEARQLEDGRVEFALDQDGERLLPRSRFFPANPGHSRWLRTSPLSIEASHPGALATPSEDRIPAAVVSLPVGFDFSHVVSGSNSTAARVICNRISEGGEWDGGWDGKGHWSEAIEIGLWVLSWHGYDYCAHFGIDPIKVSKMLTPPETYSWDEGSIENQCPSTGAWLGAETGWASLIDIGIHQLKLIGHDVCGDVPGSPSVAVPESSVFGDEKSGVTEVGVRYFHGDAGINGQRSVISIDGTTDNGLYDRAILNIYCDHDVSSLWVNVEAGTYIGDEWNPAGLNDFDGVAYAALGTIATRQWKRWGLKTFDEEVQISGTNGWSFFVSALNHRWLSVELPRYSNSIFATFDMDGLFETPVHPLLFNCLKN